MMALWEIEPGHLNKWAALTSCQQHFLADIHLVCFPVKHNGNNWVGGKWALLVTTSDQVYAAGDVPPWALDGEERSGSGPLEIAALSGKGVVGLAFGYTHYLALTGSGRVMGWGDNSRGQLGLGSRDSSTVPVELPGLSRVTSVTCGGNFSLALTQHEVYAWGDSRWARCGVDSDDVLMPRRVVFPPGISVTSIACGQLHVAAVGSDGKVYCWGRNNYGQLGRGSADGVNHSEPWPVELPSAARQVSCSACSTLALGTDGQLWVWGYVGQGGPKLDLVDSVTTPKLVMGLQRVSRVTSFWAHYYFLVQTDSTVFAGGLLNRGISQLSSFSCTTEVLANKSTPTFRISGRSCRICIDFRAEFNKPENSDVTVDLGGSRVLCHSVILRRASPLLRRMLTGVRHRGTERVLRLEGYQPSSYRAFLGYLYTGRVAFESQQELLEMYEMSRTYEVEGLRREVVEASRSYLSLSNALAFYSAVVASSARELEDTTSKFIVKNFVEIGRTDSFQALEDSLIAKLTKLYFRSI